MLVVNPSGSGKGDHSPGIGVFGGSTDFSCLAILQRVQSLSLPIAMYEVMWARANCSEQAQAIMSHYVPSLPIHKLQNGKRTPVM
jgi:hypothetical protein